jgi:hypothetical protein
MRAVVPQASHLRDMPSQKPPRSAQADFFLRNPQNPVQAPRSIIVEGGSEKLSENFTNRVYRAPSGVKIPAVNEGLPARETIRGKAAV